MSIANRAPRGSRHTIALIGRRNAGKSSLLNLLIGQQVTIVSDRPGTTTDPVAKGYELLPLGPVTFYDTAGLDDEGELGQLRVAASRKVLYRADMALVVVDDSGLTEYERHWMSELNQLKLPFLLVFNKTDLAGPSAADRAYCDDHNIPYQLASCTQNEGGDAIKLALYELAPAELKCTPPLLGDLYGPGDHLLCVVPIDMAAPVGRLILPQVQVLREALDRGALATVVKESELKQALAMMTTPPALVVADSQVIDEVDRLVPGHIPLTTYSTAFARFKGDLPIMIEGAEALDSLAHGDRILIAEACNHHAQDDDIGRVKLPRWIRRYSGKELNFDVVAGHDFPDDLEQYKLVVHCGACMQNRNEVMRRLRECQRRGVPITNYGVAISKLQGVLDRIAQPFAPKPGKAA
ncbi:[FeFe] hydrogenase H-cluster maturation GTPase HydF [Ferrimonas pelagia]|uniref:[FeFe] hydrogenase H-cluster maturation GTPase HydF n=1 Tax=Ferrimonas pelagia TaxID=1177826 RepID=A0ABP9EQY6_9GAMM